MLALTLTLLLMPQAPGVQDPSPASATFPTTKPAPVIRMWKGDAPGALGDEAHDVPTLTPYLAPAAKAHGGAVVVYPGGGYGALAGHEGEGYARWLNGLGYHAFVCRYRLGSKGYRHPVMLWDAARAVRTVRARAEEWKVDPARIGIIGSSAGGHLGSTILTHWDAGESEAEDPIDRVSSRPDFGILCYPVISMAESFTHRGSRRNLLGKEPDPKLLDLLSNERHVNAETPPTFLWHTADDGAVSVRNTYAFADALARAGVTHAVSIMAHGRHGLGLGVRDPGGKTQGELLPWTLECARWMSGLEPRAGSGR